MITPTHKLHIHIRNHYNNLSRLEKQHKNKSIIIFERILIISGICFYQQKILKKNAEKFGCNE